MVYIDLYRFLIASIIKIKYKETKRLSFYPNATIVLPVNEQLLKIWFNLC
ncbi:protein of unknown function [Cardinium endosymbiont cEper1 of Encarsia pergandiella]|nr:protein of unknown function [Cardinium endosymbiont cEper1 of Encarsia pergandiella]